MFQGSIDDLQTLNQPQVQIEAENTVDIANFLKRNDFTVTEVDDHHIYLPFTSKQDMSAINSLLNRNGYAIYSINKQQKDLEKLFLAITQNA